MPEPKTSARKLTAAERRIQALELRKAGVTYEQIGAALGITRQGAYKIVSNALDKMNETVTEQTDEIRTIEIERLDALWKVMYQQARNGNQGAVDRCLKIMERRSKLMGLDAPTKVEQENTGASTLLSEYVDDWRAARTDDAD
jgi:hypothetical protein